jgi:hypothetical protein
MEAIDEELQVGPEVLVAGLTRLGYDVDGSAPEAFGAAGHGFASFIYTIKLGHHRGETVPLGFVAPGDFPVNAPGGIYVQTDLRPLSGDSALPHGGVSDASSLLGAGWRYWSRTHDAWARSTRDAAAWMKHVDRLFADL